MTTSGLDDALQKLSARYAAASPAAARDVEEEEEEVEYVLLSVEGGSQAPLAGDVTLEVRRRRTRAHRSSLTETARTHPQGLLTDAPRVTIGNTAYQGTFDEDVGSTMLFDRSSLKRLADAQVRESRDLTLAPTNSEQPLVCVTTKRLRLAPELGHASAVGATSGAGRGATTDAAAS